MTDSREMDLDLDDDNALPLSCSGGIRCVFSFEEDMTVGTGTTKRKHSSKIYVFVEELSTDEYTLQRLNAQNVPSGELSTISRDELAEKYTPEIEKLENEVIPAMEQLEEHLDDGDMHRADGKLYSAEGCYNKALAIDEDNVRALFNLGMIYIALNDLGRAREMTKGLINMKATFDGKNQHLFNEFGISLRKSSMFNEAVEYYSKAAEYAPDDENVFFNLARANYERGTWEECSHALLKSLELRPDLDVSLELGQLIMEMHKNPKLCEEKLKAPIPAEVAKAIEKKVPKRRLLKRDPSVGHVLLNKK